VDAFLVARKRHLPSSLERERLRARVSSISSRTWSTPLSSRSSTPAGTTTTANLVGKGKPKEFKDARSSPVKHGFEFWPAGGDELAGAGAGGVLRLRDEERVLVVAPRKGAEQGEPIG